MEISVLSGINTESNNTTIIAKMKKASPELLDFFKKLHPIFMINYRIENQDTLIVSTHLPSLWKQIPFLRPIERLSTGEIDLAEAKQIMLNVAKNQIASMSAISVLHAAQKLNLDINQTFSNSEILEDNSLNRHFTIGIGKASTVSVFAGSTADSLIAFKTQRNKIHTNQLIQGMGLPIAKWREVTSEEDLSSITSKIPFPMVLKPIGLTGGHGVHVGIKDEKELLEAYNRIKSYFKELDSPRSAWQQKIIAQQMVSGDDYRILVVNGKVEIGTHRIPAQVKGDGRHTIKELIEIENKNPLRDTSLPTHTLKPIVIDEELIALLNSKNLSLSNIPQDKEIVFVRKVASMSQGGITADVTDEINPQIKLICESIADTLQANVLGVDLLCKDISKPLDIENGSIIEINTRPEIYLNTFPVIGKNYPDIGTAILQGAIDQNAHTTSIVFIGEASKELIESECKEFLQDVEKIGLFMNGSIFINGIEINKDLDIETGVLSIKKNRSVDAIILHYKNEQEILKNGFGFNKIDFLISTTKLSPALQERIDSLLTQKLIKNYLQVKFN